MDRDYALIAIAHRLSTVKNADCIYTVEDGRITDVGAHDELLDDGGLYAQLYATQRSEAWRATLRRDGRRSPEGCTAVLSGTPVPAEAMVY